MREESIPQWVWERVGLAERGAERIIVAALRAGCSQLRHELLPETIHVGGTAGTDGQRLLAVFLPTLKKPMEVKSHIRSGGKLAIAIQRRKRIRNGLASVSLPDGSRQNGGGGREVERVI